MNTKIKKNGLTLTMSTLGGFSCDNLASIPQTFEKKYDAAYIQQKIDSIINLLRGKAQAKLSTKEEDDAMSETDRIALGQERFDEVVANLQEKTSGLSPFASFLFWLGDWDYYHHDLMMGVRFSDRGDTHDTKADLRKEILTAVLPEEVRDTVSDMRLCGVATNSGHFAMLFTDEDRCVRRIVTNTQLFELRGVCGYSYLDVTPDGKPIARSRCNNGGNRGFFDGYRLMGHDKFQTCAPKTTLFDSGYKVNSTNCTIINGQLFNLIDSDDKVARTTGAFMGCCDFSWSQHAESIALAEESAKLIQISEDIISLGDRQMKPIGVFSDSSVKLLDNGFALYEWSDFHEIENPQYNSVLIVDDSKDWIDSVTDRFGNIIEKLDGLQTSSREGALQHILKASPEAVLLDMHLTPDECFEGLWIANQLANKGFGGQIIICSSYGTDALRAMQTLIKVKTVAPGKDLDKVRLALYGKSVR